MYSPLSSGCIVAAVLLMGVIALSLSTFGLEFADLGGAFSPIFFPRIILVVLGVLCAINVVAELMARRPSAPIQWWPMLSFSIGIAAYVLMIEPLGYFLASIIVGVVMLLGLGERRPLQLVGAPLIGAGSLVLLFNHVLSMPLPTSPFTWWF